MHSKDLNVLWVCKDCGEKSLYYADIEAHKQETGHYNVAEFDLSSGNAIAQYKNKQKTYDSSSC